MKAAEISRFSRGAAPGEIVLANRWFQPLTHVSSGGGPRVSAISCQRDTREKRGEHRFAVAQQVAQSVPGPFPIKGAA